MKRVIKILCCTLLLVIGLHKACLWTKPFGNLLDGVEFSRRVYDRDGTLLRLTLTQDEAYRIHTPLADIHPSAIEGTLLFEDRYFYYHFGVNPFSLIRAFWTTYVQKERVVGASTITMQLSRMVYDIESRNLWGKMHQIMGAMRLEFLYTKEEILEAYLNLAPYGFNIEGVGAAGEIYFGKDAKHLHVEEGLSLSVIPQSPYQRTYTIPKEHRANVALMEARERLMAMWGQAHPEHSLSDMPLAMSSPQELPFLAPHFVNDLLQSETQSSIHSTLDLALQQTYETLVREYVKRHRTKGVHNAAVLLVDADSMEVLVSIGSADFFSDEILGQVNGVTARRSPGSALKPFVYALAVEQGIIHSMTMLKDTPTPFGTYTPDNFDREFSGPLTATEALVHSRNIPALYLAAKVRSPSLHGLLKQAGIPLHDNPWYYGITIALGTSEVTMEEMAQLYAVFLNNGKHRPLRKKIEQTPVAGQTLLTPEAAFITRMMLAENPALGIERKWNRDTNPIAWKTGTSVGYRDAWTIGMVGHYVIVVWVGNFSGKGNPAFVGRKAAAPLMFDLIDALENLRDVVPFSQYPASDVNVKKVEVCAASGDLPNSHCPHRHNAWFIPGTSPITPCRIHREITINPTSGLQVCPIFTGERETRVYEFWSSDVLSLFREAGIGRKTPPPLHPLCQGESFGDMAPVIMSPKNGVSYLLRSKGTETDNIPLSAIVDANVSEVSWYVDHRYIGTTAVHTPFLWKASNGEHIIEVRDDLGRWASVKIQVKWSE